MKGLNGAEDQHQRFARYLHEPAVVRVEDEADLVTRILRDSDTTMAQSAIVRRLDRRASQLLADEGFTAWTRAMAEISAERKFLARRLRVWALLRSITVGEPWGSEEVTTGSDRFQRKAVETLPSVAVLTLLAEAGRTRRVRADVSRRLRQRHHRDRLEPQVLTIPPDDGPR
ncbi:hypothetical protein P6B95_00185 [Streptomyces atratus]|uniref:hypothetical protein n=1 Tax=Streptomyces atratus TaxID=1893 RepID=UPI001670DEEC|nr:hypothetical protein [Streptomyces atratus]WPW26051.1 hypothetical protein P6B95_00185 [Streptomyces atratus]GGT73574.1 hypothetical protein GCM10010207_84080 [Streptomyces atratus]